MANKIIRKSVDLPKLALDKLKRMATADRRPIKHYLEKVLIDHSVGTTEEKNKNSGT
jgi:hypothetical protein